MPKKGRSTVLAYGAVKDPEDIYSNVGLSPLAWPELAEQIASLPWFCALALATQETSEKCTDYAVVTRTGLNTPASEDGIMITTRRTVYEHLKCTNRRNQWTRLLPELSDPVRTARHPAPRRASPPPPSPARQTRSRYPLAIPARQTPLSDSPRSPHIALHIAHRAAQTSGVCMKVPASPEDEVMFVIVIVTKDGRMLVGNSALKTIISFHDAYQFIHYATYKDLAVDQVRRATKSPLQQHLPHADIKTKLHANKACAMQPPEFSSGSVLVITRVLDPEMRVQHNAEMMIDALKRFGEEERARIVAQEPSLAASHVQKRVDAAVQKRKMKMIRDMFYYRAGGEGNDAEVRSTFEHLMEEFPSKAKPFDIPDLGEAQLLLEMMFPDEEAMKFTEWCQHHCAPSYITQDRVQPLEGRAPEAHYQQTAYLTTRIVIPSQGAADDDKDINEPLRSGSQLLTYLLCTDSLMATDYDCAWYVFFVLVLFYTHMQHVQSEGGTPTRPSITLPPVEVMYLALKDELLPSFARLMTLPSELQTRIMKAAQGASGAATYVLGEWLEPMLRILFGEDAEATTRRVMLEKATERLVEFDGSVWAAISVSATWVSPGSDSGAKLEVDACGLCHEALSFESVCTSASQCVKPSCRALLCKACAKSSSLNGPMCAQHASAASEIKFLAGNVERLQRTLIGQYEVSEQLKNSVKTCHETIEELKEEVVRNQAIASLSFGEPDSMDAKLGKRAKKKQRAKDTPLSPRTAPSSPTGRAEEGAANESDQIEEMAEMAEQLDALRDARASLEAELADARGVIERKTEQCSDLSKQLSRTIEDHADEIERLRSALEHYKRESERKGTGDAGEAHEAREATAELEDARARLSESELKVAELTERAAEQASNHGRTVSALEDGAARAAAELRQLQDKNASLARALDRAEAEKAAALKKAEAEKKKAEAEKAAALKKAEAEKKKAEAEKAAALKKAEAEKATVLKKAEAEKAALLKAQKAVNTKPGSVCDAPAKPLIAALESQVEVLKRNNEALLGANEALRMGAGFKTYDELSGIERIVRYVDFNFSKTVATQNVWSAHHRDKGHVELEVLVRGPQVGLILSGDSATQIMEKMRRAVNFMAVCFPEAYAYRAPSEGVNEALVFL